MCKIRYKKSLKMLRLRFFGPPRLAIPFVCAQNEYQSYKNIMQACFRMIDKNVADQVKASNIPSLMAGG
jgi:hypothetical protein